MEYRDNRKIYPIQASGSPLARGSGSRGSHEGFAKSLQEDLADFNGDMQKGIRAQNSLAMQPMYAADTAAWDSKDGNGDQNEEEEEVQLVHQMHHSGAKKAEALLSAFHDLEDQMDTYKTRIKELYDKLQESTNKNAELEEKVDMLEEEAHSLEEMIGQEPQDGGGVTLAMAGHHSNTNEGGAGRGPNKKGVKSGEALRGALAEQDEDEDGIDYDDFQEKEGYYKRLKEYLKKKKPFQKDIERVQAKFGKAVTSYFIFYRFVFLQIALFGIAAIVFGVLHVSVQVALYGSSFAELMTGTGFLPGFMLHSSYDEDEAVEYSLFLCIGIFVLLVSIVEHLIMEDKLMKREDARLKGNEAPYAKDLFGSWDFSACKTEKEAADQQGSISNAFITKMEESRILGRIKNRSRCDIFILYLRRFIGAILYLAVQGASFIAIALVTIYTEDITNVVAAQGLSSFSSVIAPLALNIINGAAPTLLKQITELEAWDSGQLKVNILLGRMFLSNIMNTLILAMSYLLLADPFLLAQYPSFRALLETGESGDFECRIDQCADAMFSLLVTNFFIQNAARFLVPWGKKFIQRVRKKAIIKNDPFEIEPAMINLFSYMSLVMITFPFAPLALVFLPLAFWFKIKWEVWVMLNYCARPKKTWQSQKSGVIFTSFYLATLSIIGLPAMIYFLSTKTFPKACDIQDNYVGLCTDTVSSDVCTTDKASAYYEAYGASSYPSDICSDSCGPFVSQDSSFTPIKTLIYEFSATKWIYYLTFETTYASWVSVIILILMRAFAANTVKITHEHEKFNERVQATKMAELEASLRKATKALDRMKRDKVNEDALRILSPRAVDGAK